MQFTVTEWEPKPVKIEINTLEELMDFIRRTGSNCIVKPKGLNDRMDGTNEENEIEVYYSWRE